MSNNNCPDRNKFFYEDAKDLKKLENDLCKVLIKNIDDLPHDNKHEKLANIRKEIGRKYEKTKIIIFFSKKDKKYNLYINDKIIDFGQKVNDITKGFETFNAVSKTGDSIYSLTLEELIIAEEREGQVYVSEDYMREIRREVDKRSGNKAEADL